MKYPGKAGVSALAGLAILGTGAVLFANFGGLERVKLGLSVVAFGISTGVAVTSLLYLLGRNDRLDALAISAARSGVVATTLALIAASLVQRSISTSWWAWGTGNAMLLLLWLAYIGYFLLRASAEPADRSARFAAVFATITAVDVPFLYLGVRSFVARAEKAPAAGTFELDPAGITLLMGLFLSFLAGMFYLYALERQRHGRVPAPVSSKVSDGVIP